jgi:hypothetical protein
MTVLNRLRKIAHQVNADSTSWGSLLLLTCGLGVLMVMMVTFSHIQPGYGKAW